MIRTALAPAFILALLVGAVACEPTSPTGPAPGADPASSPITVSDDDRLLLIASEDHGELLIVERASREVLHRVATGEGATHVIEVSPGTAVVSNRYAHTVSVVDVEAAAVLRTIQVGVEPIGLAAIDERTVAVALSGEEALAIVNLDEGTVERKVELGVKDPRAVARVGDRLLVTHLTAGVLSSVASDLQTVETLDATTVNEFGPQTHPNHLRTLTVTPDGTRVAMAHSQSNAETVRAPIGGEDGNIDEEDVFFGGGGCGYSGCATELGAVVPGVTEIDVETGTVIPAIRDTKDDANNGGGPIFADDRGMAAEPMADCFDCGGFGFMTSAPNPPNLLNPFETRFNGVDLNNPTAIALIDGGYGQMVVHMGTQNVLILRRPLAGNASDVVGQVQVGHGATGIALTHDGHYAYVWNQFDGSVTEIEVPVLHRPGSAANAWNTDHNQEIAPERSEFREVPRFTGATTTLVEDALAADASLGRKLFHDATDERISQNHAISCASCHPDGRTDGRTWQFTFGPRNTPQLGGGILNTAPFHWPGDVTTHRDLNTMTVRAFMGGSGLDTGSMDAIGAFIDTIHAAPSRSALADDLTDAQRRGREVFLDAEVGCTNCHFGDHYTDNQNWDIGTQSTPEDIRSFQTPVLHGLSRSGPYLHDGSQLTLRDLVFNVVATDRMGKGSHLTEAQLNDLVSYLDSL